MRLDINKMNYYGTGSNNDTKRDALTLASLALCQTEATVNTSLVMVLPKAIGNSILVSWNFFEIMDISLDKIQDRINRDQLQGSGDER